MKKVILGLFILIIVWIAASFTRGMFTNKTTPTKQLIITGHRGGAALGEENTIECIKHGIATGVTSIEIDVHITADKHIVVCHDATVDRTTNGHGAINDMTLEQIKALRITNAKGELTELQIPTLEEVLETINGEVELLLEIKRKNDDNPGIEAVVLDIIKQYDALSYTTFQSFNDSVLEELHLLDSSVKLEKLLVAKLIGLPIIIDGSITYFSTEKYSYIRSFNFFYGALSAPLSKYLHEHGYHTRIWTLNDPKSIPDIELDGIITDQPDLFYTPKKGLKGPLK